MSDFSLINYDFDSLKTALLNKLKTKSEWLNVNNADPVLNMFLFLMTTDSSNKFATINKTFLDAFPNITMAEEYLYRFVHFIGMDINRAISATGTVTFTIPSISAKQVIIPAGTEITISDGSIIYSTVEDRFIDPGELSVDSLVIQGQNKSLSYISDGTNNQRYFIYDTVENSNIKVYVNDVLWTEVENFFFSQNTDLHYQIVNIKNGIYVLFSDGVFGSKPQSDDVIKVEYIETLGVPGNIYQADKLTKIISNIYFDDDTIVENITVTNDEPIQNGINGNTLDEIKANVTKFFTTNPYITRKEEYRNYLLLNGLVRDVNVYAGWELFNDTDTWTTIYFYVVPRNSDILTLTEKEELFNYVKLKDIYISNLVFEDCDFISVNVGCRAKLKKSNLTSVQINEIKTNIETIISDYFNLQKAMSDYGTVFRNIYESELTERIMVIDDLRKINLSLMSVELVDVVEEDDTVFSKLLKFEQLAEEKTYLYCNDEEVGYYNSSWTLIPINNTGTGGHNWISKISSNIESLALTINILDPNLVHSAQANNIVGDSFYVRSEPVNLDDIITGNANMVFKFWESQVTFE